MTMHGALAVDSPRLVLHGVRPPGIGTPAHATLHPAAKVLGSAQIVRVLFQVK